MTTSMILDMIATCSGVDEKAPTAVSWYGGQPVNQSFAKSCVVYNDSSLDCDVYREIWSDVVSTENSNVTYISLNLYFDPSGDQAPGFIDDVRSVMSDYAKAYPQYKYYMNGGAANTYDAVNEVHALFPAQVAGTCAVVFIIVGGIFRSLFVSIRLLATIAIPITWIYGVSVIFFQDGPVNWIYSNSTPVNALYWLIPVMCFSILVGLGLDYDIFLLSRIIEYRKLGYDDRSSIVKGIYRTGGIITAAGTIMCIAFAGLLLSEEMVLNQYGFMLAFAVLCDTFIVRTLLVPAIMNLLGPINWWPGKMPEPTKDMLCQDEEPEDLSLDSDKFEEGSLVSPAGAPDTLQRYPNAVEE